MKAFWQTLSVRDQALFIAVQLFDRKHCNDLLSLLPAHQKELLGPKADVLTQLKRKARVTLLVSRLRELCVSGSDNIFQLMHESWIVDALNKEQAIIAATIMQTFSARLVERLMMCDNPPLNPQSLSQLRVGGDLGALTVQTNFVSSFFGHQWKRIFASSMSSVDDNSILSLYPHQMNKFLYVIGSLEIAGFLTSVGIRKAATYISLFPLHERAEIIKALQSFSAKSQRTWSEQNIEKIFSKSESVESLFYNAGLCALAGSFQNKDFNGAQVIAYKLPFTLGNYFLDIVQEKTDTDATVENIDFQHCLNRTAHDVSVLDRLERGVSDTK